MEKIKRFINWKFLSNFAEKKFIKRTYIYLVILPFLISVLKKYELQFIIDSIPFSWHLFFYCALFFTLGYIIYYIFAPSIIKENKDVSDFHMAGKNFTHIHQYADEMKIPFDYYDEELTKYRKRNNLRAEEDVEIDEFTKNFEPKKRKLFEFIHDYSISRETTIPPSRINSLYQNPNRTYEDYLRYKEDLEKTEKKNLDITFWKLYGYGNNYNRIALILSFVFFSAGTILFFVVAINSIYIVIASGTFKFFQTKEM